MTLQLEQDTFTVEIQTLEGISDIFCKSLDPIRLLMMPLFH